MSSRHQGDLVRIGSKSYYLNSKAKDAQEWTLMPSRVESMEVDDTEPIPKTPPAQEVPIKDKPFPQWLPTLTPKGSVIGNDSDPSEKGSLAATPLWK